MICGIFMVLRWCVGWLVAPAAADWNQPRVWPCPCRYLFCIKKKWFWNPLFFKDCRAKKMKKPQQITPLRPVPTLKSWNYCSVFTANNEFLGLYFILHCIRLTARWIICRNPSWSVPRSLESSDGLFSVSSSMWLSCWFIWTNKLVSFWIVNKFIGIFASIH